MAPYMPRRRRNLRHRSGKHTRLSREAGRTIRSTILQDFPNAPVGCSYLAPVVAFPMWVPACRSTAVENGREHQNRITRRVNRETSSNRNGQSAQSRSEHNSLDTLVHCVLCNGPSTPPNFFSPEPMRCVGFSDCGMTFDQQLPEVTTAWRLAASAQRTMRCGTSDLCDLPPLDSWSREPRILESRALCRTQQERCRQPHIRREPRRVNHGPRQPTPPVRRRQAHCSHRFRSARRHVPDQSA